MKDELQKPDAPLPADKLFKSYLHLVSKRESEEIYRMQEPAGEGIMKHTHIAKGIELVYSELESYNPCYQAARKTVDVLEIMYIAEGHAEFELENRQFASGDKGDVMFFNSRTGTRKCSLGKRKPGRNYRKRFLRQQSVAVRDYREGAYGLRGGDREKSSQS